jgi:RNA polymerase sigma-70 factor (sigma-E family)
VEGGPRVTMGVEARGMDDEVVGHAIADVLAAPQVTDEAGLAEDEFDAFVAGAGGRLLRTAYLLTGDRGAAEDLVQDVLVRAWSHWARVSGADQPQAYVRRMLVNASVSRWRALRARRHERLVAEPPDRAGTDSEQHDDELWALVATLPARQRAVVVLSYYEDLPDAEVADALGCSTGTVKSQRAKALRSMRTRLAEEES